MSNTIAPKAAYIPNLAATTKPAPKAADQAPFGLDVVDFHSSQVKASDNLTPPCIAVAEGCSASAHEVRSDNDLYPGCTGQLAFAGCLGLNAHDVKADNDLYPGCTGELAMSGCLGLNAHDVKADNDLYPGCTGYLAMGGCLGLNASEMGFFSSSLHV